MKRKDYTKITMKIKDGLYGCAEPVNETTWALAVVPVMPACTSVVRGVSYQNNGLILW